MMRMTQKASVVSVVYYVRGMDYHPNEEQNTMCRRGSVSMMRIIVKMYTSLRMVNCKLFVWIIKVLIVVLVAMVMMGVVFVTLRKQNESCVIFIEVMT